MPIRTLCFFILVSISLPILGQDCENCVPYTSGAPAISLPRWPLELIPVATPEYPRNSRATFCQRPIEMVDTIVLHHTATSATETPLEINRAHLNEGTSADPWYMVAYSFLINGAYPGQSSPSPVVSEGRPLEIVGAHAGSNVFIPMNEEQQRLWNSGKITCGRENGTTVANSSLVQSGRIKANVTTIGVTVIGNYAPRSVSNPLGYNRSKPRNPSPRTIESIAKLSCQLQKKYPNMKMIKWHSQYHSTECPGTIKNFIGQIKSLAKGYGCVFN